ncbi:MAG: hypothetical protein C7B46_02855 [Sulfobacillus benefaciens]|uniref:CAAX prenyl protease 2/Lysostaphin resistance protein A-like domain-containing protein n=1 Tax=Sulfobacillus benefaciens TaxID=453960 RepID=A0A2T2XK55_9FIRM|nr:MAG: hypothetical protein C7B46_02855 [Sulfobacillus benefaciens]
MRIPTTRWGLFDAYVVVGWVFLFRLRFPLGAWSWPALRAWFHPWLVVGGGYLLLTLLSPGPPLHQDILAWLVFQGIVVGPTEEILFRGLIQTTLNRVIGRTLGRLRWGTIVAAFAFGLAHLANLLYQPLTDTLGQIAFATVVGGFSATTMIGHRISGAPPYFIVSLI